jgi:hypothetical protein
MPMNRVVASGSTASAAYACFNAVSIVQSNFKTALTCAHHAIRFAKYTHRYRAEFQYRFNRRFDTRAILGRLARILVVARSRFTHQALPHRRGCTRAGGDGDLTGA